MTTLQYVILFSLLGGVFSLIGGLLLLSRKQLAENLAKYATPFAAGALLAAVFLDLLKEGIEQAKPDTVLLSALIGLLIFFFAERFLHWFHHHHQHEQADPSKALIIAGDIAHNALDGVAIAAAFLVSIPTGIVTTIAVASHEIPQEIGDFGLLLSKGMSRARVLWVNIASALATTVAAVAVYIIGDQEKLPIGVLLGLSAGFLLYIAASDIIPELHEKASKARFFDWQPALLLAGVIVVGLAVTISHNVIESQAPGSHNHSQHEQGEHEEDHESEHSEHAEGEHSGHDSPTEEEHEACIMIYPPPAGCE